MPDTPRDNAMAQKVKGYLASDGRFFEHEAECRRHEHAQSLISLCDSHNINPENFFALIREWNVHIKGYYDADAACKEPTAVATGNIQFTDGDLSQDDINHEDPPVGDKDAPSFLEQQARRSI